VFTSPFPPAECARRLEEATTRGSGTGFRGPAPIRASRPLYGTLGWPEVQVKRARTGSGSLQVYFDGLIKPTSGGGTMLRGTIGLQSPNVALWVASSVIGLVFIVAVAIGMVSGTVPGGTHGVVLPAVLAIGDVAMLALIPSRVSSQARQLLYELSRVLEATATMEE